LPIENAHILQLSHLPLFADHKDPFDRLLVAQSLSEPLILLTVDDKLARYGRHSAPPYPELAYMAT